jgi:N-acetyl-gamma-glutamyl-phosphate reductase
MTSIKAGIIGAAGYTGGELIRLLLNHPTVEISFAHSRSNAGKPIASIHQDLLGNTELCFNGEINNQIDVLFLCLGHGESTKFLAENKIADNIKIIDLANDFRLQANAKQDNRTFVYGLPELNREEIKKANNIANPGCFATAIQLGLLPLASQQLIEDVYTTGITGSTGAGQALTASSHFSWRANNIQAYKTLTHQHLGEIGESLIKVGAAKKLDISFVPWRGDFTRGIFISSTITLDKKLDEVYNLFESFYANHPFTTVSKEPIFLKQVVNTNKAIIQIEKAGSKLVIHSIIDNLLKGAVGQAVQNMNLVFGLPETTGLSLKANYF